MQKSLTGRLSLCSNVFILLRNYIGRLATTPDALFVCQSCNEKMFNNKDVFLEIIKRKKMDKFYIYKD